MSRFDGAPRGASRREPAHRTAHPATAPAVKTSSSTRWRWWNVTNPRACRGVERRLDERFDHPCRCPHATWNRGTRVVVPIGAQIAAPPTPPSAGTMPWLFSQDRFSGGPLDIGAGPLQRPGVLVVEPVEARAARQSFQASSKESLTPIRRCSGLSTEQATERPEGLAAEVKAAFSGSTSATFLAAAGQFVWPPGRPDRPR